MADRLTDDRVCEIHFGPHVFRWEPPDLGHMIYDGPVDGPMVTSFAEKGRPFLLKKPRLFMLVDVTRLSRINAEARQISAQNSKGLNLRGVAMVGASPTMRAIAGLVSRAVDLLNRSNDNPTRFFETELEARAWIAARRDVIQGSGKQT